MKFPLWLKRLAVCLLLTALSSCAAAKHDPEILRARGNVVASRKTYLQGAALGGLAGAGAGAIIGHQTGNKHGTQIGAIIGGGLGMVGGLLWANHVVKQRQYYADTAAYLKDCGRVAQAKLASVRKYNQTVASRIKTMRGDTALARGTAADSRSVQANLRTEIALQQAALEGTAGARGNGAGQARALRNHIALLEAEDRRLTAHLERLAEISTDRSLAKAERR